ARHPGLALAGAGRRGRKADHRYAGGVARRRRAAAPLGGVAAVDAVADAGRKRSLAGASVRLGALRHRRGGRLLRLRLPALFLACLLALPAGAVAAHHIDPFEAVQEIFETFRKNNDYPETRAMFSRLLRDAAHDGKL